MTSNKRIRIKVCGMTRPQDVAVAVSLGVDAIGMILHADSPRCIDTDAAQAIRAQVPAFVTLVGVFVNADADLVNKMIAEIDLDLVQLHGDEDEDYAKSLNTGYIKAIRAKSRVNVEQALRQFSSARALLLDTYVKGKPGGTGSRLNPALWPTKAAQTRAAQKLILAGGLSADNIETACAATMPYAIDLNSGVESAPGIKDAELIAQAVNVVRSI